MKKTIFALLMVMVASMLFAYDGEGSDSDNRGGRMGQNQFLDEELELESFDGRIEISDFGEVLFVVNRTTYLLRIPYSDELSDLEDGDRITIEGFVTTANNPWMNEEFSCIIAKTVTFDGETIEIEFPGRNENRPNNSQGSGRGNSQGRR